MAKTKGRSRRLRAYIKRIVMPISPVGVWNTRAQAKEAGAVPVAPRRSIVAEKRPHWPEGERRSHREF